MNLFSQVHSEGMYLNRKQYFFFTYLIITITTLNKSSFAPQVREWDRINTHSKVKQKQFSISTKFICPQNIIVQHKKMKCCALLTNLSMCPTTICSSPH